MAQTGTILVYDCNRVGIRNMFCGAGCKRMHFAYKQAEKNDPLHFRYASKNTFSFSNGITSI